MNIRVMDIADYDRVSLRRYAMAGNFSLEVYTSPAENPADTVSYIWIPLKKA